MKVLTRFVMRLLSVALKWFKSWASSEPDLQSLDLLRFSHTYKLRLTTSGNKKTHSWQSLLNKCGALIKRKQIESIWVLKMGCVSFPKHLSIHAYCLRIFNNLNSNLFCCCLAQICNKRRKYNAMEISFC